MTDVVAMPGYACDNGHFHRDEPAAQLCNDVARAARTGLTGAQVVADAERARSVGAVEVLLPDQAGYYCPWCEGKALAPTPPFPHYAQCPSRTIRKALDRLAKAEAERDRLGQAVRDLITKWRGEATEADEDGDICCGETRRNDAKDIEAILAASGTPEP